MVGSVSVVSGCASTEGFSGGNVAVPFWGCSVEAIIRVKVRFLRV